MSPAQRQAFKVHLLHKSSEVFLGVFSRFSNTRSAVQDHDSSSDGAFADEEVHDEGKVADHIMVNKVTKSKA